MCGIAGFVALKGTPDDDTCRKDLETMVRLLEHRGPDAEGFWSDRDRGVYLGHRRLSIIDLSEQGAQPMVSAGGRFVIVYNGEIYNFRELRRQLASAGVDFRGDSDTEVLVNGFEEWGIATTLKKLVGMFALALWDRHERELTLMRDRAGEKPLYYGWVGNRVVFASELKAIKAISGFDNQLARSAVASFMRFSYVPAPFSIYENIFKIEAGTYATIPLNIGSNCFYRNDAEINPPVENVPYWSARDVMDRDVPPNGIDRQEAVNHLDELIRRSVSRQMISDVPLGAMLSGGIDSSTIVAIMQSLSCRPVKTFTIGFNEREYNEAIQAREIARYLGTDHTEMYVSATEALDVVPNLARIYDEPFADSSQIPTYLVAKLARSDVTVALSGDAGDELFGGYTRYLWAERIWKNMQRLPVGLRGLVARGVLSLPRATWGTIYHPLEPLVPARSRVRNAGEKVHALGRLLNEDTREAVYRHIISHWTPEDELVLGSSEYPTSHMKQDTWPKTTEFVERMMYLDFVSYLPDDILVKLDRATMHVSLETRVPFLDRDIIEYAYSLPLDLKIKNGKGKWILREVLSKYLPNRYFERPKMGFGVPVGEWLNGPLRPWAEDMLDPGLLKRQGVLNSDTVTEKWNSHKAGQGNWQYHLWDVLMFQMWNLQEEKNKN